MENMLLNREVMRMEEYKKHKVEFEIIPEFNSVNADIYTGSETMQFNNRHPIFKALMKLEFEDVIRNYHKRICPR